MPIFSPKLARGSFSIAWILLFDPRDRSAFLAAKRGNEVRTGLAAGGRWIRTLGPRVMDGDLGRQVPALIAVFELAATAVTLQRGTNVIRPDRHPKFP